MKRAWMAVLAAIGMVSSGGCGTICNFAHGDPDIYGGVQKDVEFMQAPRTAVGVASGKGGVVFLALVAGDVGLCLVADTLTLPLAIYMRQKEHASENEGVPVDGGNQVKTADKATPAISLGESRPDDRLDAEGQDAKNEAGEPVPSDMVKVQTKQQRPATSLPTNAPLPP